MMLVRAADDQIINLDAVASAVYWDGSQPGTAAKQPPSLTIVYQSGQKETLNGASADTLWGTLLRNCERGPGG